MMTVVLRATWKGSGTLSDPYRPAILDDHPALSWQDISGKTHGSADYQIKATMSLTTYQAILSDPKYGAAAVLSATAL